MIYFDCVIDNAMYYNSNTENVCVVYEWYKQDVCYYITIFSNAIVLFVVSDILFSYALNKNQPES